MRFWPVLILVLLGTLLVGSQDEKDTEDGTEKGLMKPEASGALSTSPAGNLRSSKRRRRHIWDYDYYGHEYGYGRAYEDCAGGWCVTTRQCPGVCICSYSSGIIAGICRAIANPG